MMVMLMVMVIYGDDDDDDDDEDEDGGDAKKRMEPLVAGKKYIQFFARSSTGFYKDNIFPNGTTHETCEIKDCSLHAVELHDSYNTESLKMLFYTTAAYGRWT